MPQPYSFSFPFTIGVIVLYNYNLPPAIDGLPVRLPLLVFFTNNIGQLISSTSATGALKWLRIGFVKEKEVQHRRKIEFISVAVYSLHRGFAMKYLRKVSLCCENPAGTERALKWLELDEIE